MSCRRRHSVAIRRAALIALLVALPAPSVPIPTAPRELAVSLQRTEHALGASIDSWDKSSPPPRNVTLLALYRQRVIRVLATDAALARGVERMDPAVAGDVVARRDLFRLVSTSPLPKGTPRLGPAAPAARLLAWYREAQRRFGVRWQVLAAVNFVESAFGKVRNVSGAGAQGPMQFEPATWRRYGLGGNVDDPHDAILGAADYLAASGAVHDERAALYAYNHSPLYVDAVRRYANRIARDRRAFFEYYSWQVYFRTPSGYRRVTGPR